MLLQRSILSTCFSTTRFTLILLAHGVKHMAYNLGVALTVWLTDLGNQICLWWFDFKLKPNFTTAPAAFKNYIHYKSGQNWLENSHLTTLIWIDETDCNVFLCTGCVKLKSVGLTEEPLLRQTLCTSTFPPKDWWNWSFVVSHFCQLQKSFQVFYTTVWLKQFWGKNESRSPKFVSCKPSCHIPYVKWNSQVFIVCQIHLKRYFTMNTL